MVVKCGFPFNPGGPYRRICEGMDKAVETLPRTPTWDLQWKLIQSVGDNGDAGALDQVQALAQEPAAALAMVLRAPTDDLPQVLALDMAAPIFWPVLPISAFQTALNCDLVRLVGRYARVLDQERSQNRSGEVTGSPHRACPNPAS